MANPSHFVPGSGPPGAERSSGGGLRSGEWTLSALKASLWQRRWLVMIIAAEVFLIAAAVTYLRTPQYDATVRLLIERSTPNVLDSEDVVPMAWNEFEIMRFYQTQYLLVKDPAVLQRAVKRDGIREELIARARDRHRGNEEFEIPTDFDLAETIRSSLSIEQLEYSNVIAVTYRDESPELAAKVVNAIARNYQGFFVETGLSTREDASDFLKKQIQDAQAEVLALERLLAEERQNVGEAASASDEIRENRLQVIDRKLTDAKARRAASHGALDALRESDPLGHASIAADRHVSSSLNDLSEIRRQIAELEGRVGPQWPRLVELRTAEKELQQNLDAYVAELYRRMISIAEAEYRLAFEEARRLTQLYDDESSRTTALQVVSGDLSAKLLEYEHKKLAVARLLERREEVALTAQLQNILKNQVTIVGEAQIPVQAAVPRVRLNLALGAFLGLMLGLFAAIFAELINSKIRTADQLQQIANIPILGSIPPLAAVSNAGRKVLIRERRNRSGARTPTLNESQHEVEEAFRALRSALLLSQPEHPPRSLMITSALPGEGKSTIVANLSRTLAQFGNRVLMIDADLRHPRLHRVFGLECERGLTNAIASEEENLPGLIVKTSYPGLSLLPGGPCPPDPATLLQPSRLKQIIAQIEATEAFDLIIIDTPPVLVFADAFNIVPAVEATIVIARAMKTTGDVVRKMMQSLSKINARILGAVLNGEEGDDSGGAYYGYYYRSGQYREVAEERRRMKGEPGPPPISSAPIDADKRAG